MDDVAFWVAKCEALREQVNGLVAELLKSDAKVVKLEMELENLKQRVNALEIDEMCNTEGLWGEDFSKLVKKGKPRE